MSREESPFVYSDYWLDKRRDGRSPEVWQIATYSAKSRCVVYRSTKRRAVEEAKASLVAFVVAEQSKSRHQPEDQSLILPHLFNYLREHGEDVQRLDTIKSSFRAWIGFLQQDELGTNAVISDVDKLMVARFRRWRMPATTGRYGVNSAFRSPLAVARARP